MRVIALRRDGVALLALGVVLVGVCDAILLEAGRTFFTAGFNSVHLAGAGEILMFLLAGAVLDLWLFVGVFALLLPLLARTGGTRLQKLLVAWGIALAIPLGISVVEYRLAWVLGRMAKVTTLTDVAAGSFGVMANEAILHAAPLLALLAATLLFALPCLVAIGRLQHRFDASPRMRVPRTRRLLGAFALLSGVAMTTSVAANRLAPTLNVGLAAKPSAALLNGILERITDVDGDGFGLLSRPADPAPFDGSRHPFARDLPGNGIDENGLAGDLPTGWVAPEPIRYAAPSAQASRRPDLLMIYLESFRADLIGRRRAGREITPVLNALAREGASSRHAFVHSPYTIWSRAQLFGGRLVPHYGQRTLIDDFGELGYTVALISGQDDSFGRSAELVGSARADFLWDARKRPERTTSRSTSPGSLQVSSKLVLEQATEFLQQASASAPLLLYVNFTDTHFPYHHTELDDLLGTQALTRADINSDNAELVRAAYDNAAANVDHTIGLLIERFRGARALRDHGILVTSDHGQALFERDFLGHGQSLTADQTRTPFIVWGIGGDWPEPLGMADVRGLLARNLFVVPTDTIPVARFVPDPERRLFQFMARIAHPRLIGLRSQRGLTSFEFASEVLELYDAQDERAAASEAERLRAYRHLIFTWETIRQREHAPPAASPDDGVGPA